MTDRAAPPPAPPGSLYPATIKPLTSFRFLAAFAVFAHHILRSFHLRESWMTIVAAKGYLGVDFFFILSGFILTHVYASVAADGALSVHRFLIHRLARIYPMHLFTLLIAGAIGLARLPGWNGAVSWSYLVQNLLLVHAWGNARDFSFNLVSWSISAEWFAYLGFPLLIAWSVSRRPALSVVAALVLTAAASLATHLLFQRSIIDMNASFAPLRIMPEFTLGLALYRAGAARPWRASPWVALAALVGLLAALAAGAPDIICLPAFLLIIHAGAGSSLREDKTWLSRPLPVYLGEISFAFYMLHIIVIFGAWTGNKAFQSVPLWSAAAFIVTLLAAHLSHRYLEYPLRRLIRRLDGDGPPRVA